MVNRQDIYYLSTIIALVTLPSVASLSYYMITNDPSLRPLGITQESLRAFSGEAAGIEIIAVIEWDATHSNFGARAEMQRALTRVFKTKGVDIRVLFRNGQNGTFVTYQVGASIIGPYQKSRAAEGISAAIAAYRMHVPYAP